MTASLSLVVAAISAYAYVGYTQAQDSVGIIPDAPSSSGGAPAPDFGPCVDDVCNYLILGSDSRAGLSADEQDQFGTDEDIGGSNRSDVIMLVHTDPRLQKAIVLSFPRDLWVNIPGRGFDKINSAFSGGLEGGGAQLVAKTVEELSGLKINHVLYVDLAGFQGIVEALGRRDDVHPDRHDRPAHRTRRPGRMPDARRRTRRSRTCGPGISRATWCPTSPGSAASSSSSAPSSTGSCRRARSRRRRR